MGFESYQMINSLQINVQLSVNKKITEYLIKLLKMFFKNCTFKNLTPH